jgi:uncharacterized protein
VSVAAKGRRSNGSDDATGRSEGSVATSERPPRRPDEKPPFLLDFFPVETPDQTRLSRFYDRLREGRLSTTRCPHDGKIHWPPRVTCPECHQEDLEWIDLPESGTIFAFSAVLAGAPLTLESDVPYAVGLVDLDGVDLRLFGRIDGKSWTELAIGERVAVEPYEVGDGRVFYRFRASD